MKFVCDRCQTRYSIADEKVRQKILRIRCKTCGNVIVVQDEHGRGSSAASDATAAPSSGPKAEPSSRPKAAPASGPKSGPSSTPKASPPPPPRPTKGADPLGGQTEWYVAFDGVESGPFTRAEVARRIHAAGPGKSAHVWKDGMPGWKPADEVSVVARELKLLGPASRRPPRESPPPPPPLVRPAPDGRAGAAPKEASSMPSAVADDGQTADETFDALQITSPSHSAGFSDITTKKGKELGDLAKASMGENFVEVTTKKGKNLRELESDSFADAGSELTEIDQTPPPMEPLPPVGAKVAAVVSPGSRTPAAPKAPPVAPFLSPATPPAPRPASLPSSVASFVAPGSPPSAQAAPFAVPSAPLSAPSTPLPPPAASFEFPGAPTPPPVAGSPARISSFAFPVAPDSLSKSQLSVPAAAPGPSFTTGDLPTPRPVSLAPLGDPMSLSVDADLRPGQGGLAALFQRQSGLKYVVAAVAIVGLIILLGLVILRSSGDKIAEPATPLHEEPPTVEQPKSAPPAEIPSPPPPPLPPVVENPAAPAPAPESKPGGRRGSGRTVHRTRPVRERAVKAPQPAKPPRLSGGRPNPFDDAKTVSQSQITAVVRNPANQAGLKSCYERALKMDNRLTSGRIDVTVSIGASGAVKRVVINAPASFILVEPCIKSAVKRWVFPRNTEEYGTNFPLILQGGM